MADVVELTIGLEVTDPGPVSYSSRRRTSSVTVRLAPGEDVDAAILKARGAAERALIAAPAAIIGGPAVASPPAWSIRIPGAVGEQFSFKKFGLRWDGKSFTTVVTTKREDAVDLARRLCAFASDRSVTITNPDGTTETMGQVSA